MRMEVIVQVMWCESGGVVWKCGGWCREGMVSWCGCCGGYVWECS